MTELNFQLYETSLRAKTAIVRHGKPHFAPSYPSEPQNSGWPVVLTSSSFDGRNPSERYHTVR